MKLSQNSKVRGDETASYSVELEKLYSVCSLIDEILSREKEWGYIGIECSNEIFGNPKCEYRYGELVSKLPEEYLSKTIVSVKAHGGWSRMDYRLVVK